MNRFEGHNRVQMLWTNMQTANLPSNPYSASPASAHPTWFSTP